MRSASHPYLWSRIMLALGVAGLGVVGLITGDFMGRWQPVPASLPLHRGLAWLSGLLLLACGAGLVRRGTMRYSALALALFLLLWVAALLGPPVILAPADAKGWLYLGEVLAIACGALMLWALPNHGRVTNAARLGFGVSLLTFGAFHFAYLDVTASVVPAYIPNPIAVTRITGAAHLAAGAALLVNRLPRLAAALEAAMMSGFVLMINLPDVIHSPMSRSAWMAFFAEGSLVAAAWIVAIALRESGSHVDG